MKPITTVDIRHVVRELGLSGRPLCVHSSLSSFEQVEGGVAAIIDGLQVEGCTVLVPTFTSAFQVLPPPGRRLKRNGSDYDSSPKPTPKAGEGYCPGTREIDNDMGAIPATIVTKSERIRGDHPICSFSAVGPMARELVSGQAPLDVFAPLRALADKNGTIALMGVGLESMTPLCHRGLPPFMKDSAGNPAACGGEESRCT